MSFKSLSAVVLSPMNNYSLVKPNMINASLIQGTTDYFNRATIRPVAVKYSDSSKVRQPEGHIAMDKPLACHAGGRVWTQMRRKILLLLSSWDPWPRALSLSQCLSSIAPVWILVMGEVKERNQGKILAAPSVGQNKGIRVMYGRKGVKKGKSDPFHLISGSLSLPTCFSGVV